MSRSTATVPHPQTTVSPLLFGTMLFLASELLLFGGLFAAYFSLRARTTSWPPDGADLDRFLAAIATIVLVVSSATYQFAARAADRGDHRSFIRWLVASVALGTGFLAMQGYDYASLGFAVDTHAYGTMYFTMTGVHALHVLAGIVLMLVVAARGGRMIDEQSTEFVHASGYYWHFVDVVWVALFTVLFVVR